MKARRTHPVSIRAVGTRSIVTDANGTEHDFRGATLAQLEVTAGKLEADAIWAAKKAAYLRAAIALETASRAIAGGAK